MDDSGRFDVVGLIDPLRRYARSLTRDGAQAEDLVQDALIRAYERRDTFRQGASLRTWLLSILHNVFVDERRRAASDARRARQVLDLADEAVSPEQEGRLRLRQVAELFEKLPAEQRAVLHLVAIEGLSYSEAAAALGIPVGTLMSRLGRARAALRAAEGGSAEDGSTRTKPALRLVGGQHD